MSDQFLAEIRPFAWNRIPYGWAACAGQLLPISANTALFSLLGTTYGGDGRSNFGLPNLQGMVGISAGQGPGLQTYQLGETGGSATVTLLLNQNGAHGHPLNADNEESTANAPANALYQAGHFTDGSTGGKGGVAAYSSQSPNAALNGQAIQPAGGNQPHNNMMPYLTLTYCIALTGIYPQRG
jgi:microcystin-dependent protein